LVGPTSPERKTDRAHSVRTSLTHESKAFRLLIAFQRLASNDLEASFRPSAPILHVSTIAKNNRLNQQRDRSIENALIADNTFELVGSLGIPSLSLELLVQLFRAP